ncbi:unnamed protein product [Mytilus edulis]|uniref:DUF7869 domain-containing protein n=1 Tax=Mytilus edulis TaxID=6550 RepID=A0A8S3T198_MYTED|nr:unnamed protein product [Mytilus edulis]
MWREGTSTRFPAVYDFIDDEPPPPVRAPVLCEEDLFERNSDSNSTDTLSIISSTLPTSGSSTQSEPLIIWNMNILISRIVNQFQRDVESSFYRYRTKWQNSSLTRNSKAGQSFSEQKQAAIHWLGEYIAQRGERPPHQQEVWLPFGMRKTEIYIAYRNEQIMDFNNFMSTTSFYAIWRKFYSHVKIRSDLASTIPMKTHVTGAINHGTHQKFVFTVIYQYKHDSNLTLNILMKLLWEASKVNINLLLSIIEGEGTYTRSKGISIGGPFNPDMEISLEELYYPSSNICVVKLFFIHKTLQKILLKTHLKSRISKSGINRTWIDGRDRRLLSAIISNVQLSNRYNIV